MKVLLGHDGVQLALSLYDFIDDGRVRIHNVFDKKKKKNVFKTIHENVFSISNFQGDHVW